jgi:glutamine amidotransferase
MQLMAKRGREFETVDGLGWIDGEVVAIEPADPTFKIPHMGWNELSLRHSHPVFDGISDGTHTYFVHSFHFAVADKADLLATADYAQKLTAAVARDNMVGTQFHPEKSHAAGLRLIANFLRWRP